MGLILEIIENAKRHKKKIVLPEAPEERTLKAADIILREGIADIVLLASKETILKEGEKYNLKHLDEATFTNPLNHEKKDHYIEMMVEIRKNKGLKREKAAQLIEDPLFLATLIIKTVMPTEKWQEQIMPLVMCFGRPSSL